MAERTVGTDFALTENDATDHVILKSTLNPNARPFTGRDPKISRFSNFNDHSNTHPYDITGRPFWVGEILSKLTIVDEKLSKIIEIDAKLHQVHIMETDIINLKKTSGNMVNTTDTLRKTSEEIKGQICELEKARQAMEDTITDLQSRSMQENLLFFGLAEYKGERKENCVSLIDDFCETQLGLSSIGENIERAHRVGKFDEGRNKPRPIVVKFSSFRRRESVREQARLLSGTKFRIQEQFPRKINEARKKLFPIMNEARRNGQRVSLARDKLYIDGREHKPEPTD